MKAYLARRRSTAIKEVEIKGFKGNVVVTNIQNYPSGFVTEKKETEHRAYCETKLDAINWLVDKAEQDISTALGVINRAEKVIDHFAEEIQNVVDQ